MSLPPEGGSHAIWAVTRGFRLQPEVQTRTADSADTRHYERVVLCTSSSTPPTIEATTL